MEGCLFWGGGGKIFGGAFPLLPIPLPHNSCPNAYVLIRYSTGDWMHDDVIMGFRHPKSPIN